MSNFFSLSFLQGINIILPLITLPYIVRVLGVENFGLLNFSLSIIMYFNILVSFGFDLSATREISINRDNLLKVSEIFLAVMIIKSILLLLSFLLLTILLFSLDSLKENFMLFYATFGIVVGNMMFPVWFFQGMERMKYITYINVIVKSGFTMLIFVLIDKNQDFIYVPILNSFATILGALYSLLLVFKLFKVKLIFPNRETIMNQFMNSYHFFLSRLANEGSRYYAITIVGIYFGNTIVGYYTMVEKLFYAFMSLGGIVSQTIYPYMSRTKDIVFFKKIFFLVVSIFICILIPVLYFNEILLFKIFHVENEILTNIFIIVFSGSIFGIISSLIGYPLLAAFGYIKYANNSLIYASIIYVMYIFLSISFFKNIYLLSFSLIVYAIIGLLFRIYYIKKTKLLIKSIQKKKSI